MPFRFKDLHAKLTGQPTQPTTARGRIRQTAADQFQARVNQKQQSAPATPENLFLSGRIKLTQGVDFMSTNPAKPAVYQVWYVPAKKEVHVTFYDNTTSTPKPGPTYRYWTVDAAEAGQMFRASSKGIAVWDQFRVRGSKTAHRKNYAKV